MLKIAYLILAHHDSNHLERLIKAINYKAHIFIHLDKKTSIDSYQHIANIESVTFISNRVKVYWGGISMVTAILSLIEAALTSEEDFSHLVLLSGNDYPIKLASNFYDFLENNPDRQFIKCINIDRSPKPSQKRVDRYWFIEPFQPFVKDKIFRSLLQKVLNLTIKRRLPSNISFAWGSGNWAITAECADFILKFSRQYPELLRFCRYSHCPDEFFFHTVVANSPFLKEAGSLQEEIRWPHEVSNITLNFEGRVWVEEDYEFLEDLSFGIEPSSKRMSISLERVMGASLIRQTFDYSSFFFARKFTTQKSSSLLDLIDKKLLNSRNI